MSHFSILFLNFILTFQAIEGGHYSRSSDVHSFGVVLWELVAAKLPYPELTNAAAAVAIVGRKQTLEKPIDDRLE